MFQIKRPILAALALDNGSGESLRQANELARAHGVDLCICHVLPEIYAARPLFPQFHLDDALKVTELEANVRSRLRERVRAETSRGPDQVEVLVEQGTAHSGILRAAERIDAGAVVVGGKVNIQGQPVLGRAAELVVRYAHCPVLVARFSPQGKVLAATDFSDPSLPAVEAGAVEADHLKADLTIIHVVDLAPLMIPGVNGIYPEPPQELSDQIMWICQKKLDECVGKYGAKGGGVIHVGAAVPSILQESSRLPAQLLVVGTHGRTGLARLTLGNVAEAIVRAAPCSTLVVRLSRSNGKVS